MFEFAFSFTRPNNLAALFFSARALTRLFLEKAVYNLDAYPPPSEKPATLVTASIVYMLWQTFSIIVT